MRESENTTKQMHMMLSQTAQSKKNNAYVFFCFCFCFCKFIKELSSILPIGFSLSPAQVEILR